MCSTRHTSEKEQNVFQATLNLPQTSMPIRANAHEREPEILKLWEEQQLGSRATVRNKGKQKFILHDGPPFANGHLHMGHALTYVLKDMICKFKRMSGYHVPLIPGWDCHGLPIELKVAAELSAQDKGDRRAFKKACRDYVNRWIAIQKKELKELGKLADFDHPYVTMDHGYEAAILRSLAMFVEKGHIQRKGKTVPWCASCQTVLAAAEIEYNDRKDPSCFVAFTLDDRDARMTFPLCFEQDNNLSISCVVWTTTPWTIPLNRAVVLNPSSTYVVLKGKTEHESYVVAKDLADAFCAQVGVVREVLAECNAQALLGKWAHHPLSDGVMVPVLCDEAVIVSEGTACLHCAPGCGPEDYLLGIKHGLEIYSPVGVDGRYTTEIKPQELVGMPVAEGQFWVLKQLAIRGKLVHKASITHSYPHCWRCHQGLIFRATDQWFCDLQKNDLIARSLKEIESILFVPDWGKNRLHAFVSNRTEWCISRQRQWGVPIVALRCGACNRGMIDADMIRTIAAKVEQHGIEYWDEATVESLMHDGIISSVMSCSCGASVSDYGQLERDILDGWFDSGVSNAVVLRDKNYDLAFPADVYLEGSDQHRGWFQSSLLCSMVLHDQTPTKTIVTHGFVVDEQKRKMSKSVGNVIAPSEVMAKYSRDILRLWVASADFEGDVVISEKLLGNVAEVYRKIRNTCRFMLSNLYDFDVTKDSIAAKNLEPLDCYALDRLYAVYHEVCTAYEAYKFAQVVSIINNYCVSDLSAIYLDIVKDRLYVEKKDSHLRRSAQTALFQILDVLTHLLAPILSFTAEDIASYYGTTGDDSIHLHDLPQPANIWQERAKERMMSSGACQAYTEQQKSLWQTLEQLRSAVLKAIEPQRASSVIKHSLEAQVTLHIAVGSTQAEQIKVLVKELADQRMFERFFIDWCIVSGVTIAEKGDGLESTEFPWLKVSIEKASGDKCPRCWHWSMTGHEQKLCERCCSVIE